MVCDGCHQPTAAPAIDQRHARPRRAGAPPMIGERGSQGTAHGCCIGGLDDPYNSSRFPPSGDANLVVCRNGHQSGQAGPAAFPRGGAARPKGETGTGHQRRHSTRINMHGYTGQGCRTLLQGGAGGIGAGEHEIDGRANGCAGGNRIQRQPAVALRVGAPKRNQKPTGAGACSKGKRREWLAQDDIAGAKQQNRAVVSRRAVKAIVARLGTGIDEYVTIMLSRGEVIDRNKRQRPAQR